MGGGRWDDDVFTSAKSSRRSAGVDDFAYSQTATAVHTNLDPRRINNKPFGKLESRDSTEHPESNAVLVGFDVTGSNINRARDAQKALPALMKLLGKYLSDPQVAVAANDDYLVEPEKCVQISDFESDIRIDEHIRNVILVGNGGGNGGESYDLLLYAAARKTILDCFEKRGRKGYLFLYADENFREQVKKNQVSDVFGDTIDRNIPIADMVEEARELYHVFVLWPVGGYEESREQYERLFGREYVITLEHPDRICEVIGVTIGVNEQKIDAATAASDLMSVGVSKQQAASISQALVPLSRNRSVARATGKLPVSRATKAARL